MANIRQAERIFTSYLHSEEAVRYLAGTWYANIFLPFEILLQAVCFWSFDLGINVRGLHECVIQTFDKATSSFRYVDLLSLDYNELPRTFAELIHYCCVHSQTLFQLVQEHTVLCSSTPIANKTCTLACPRFKLRLPRAGLLLACLECELTTTTSIEKTYDSLAKAILDTRDKALVQLMKEICNILGSMADMNFDARRQLLHAYSDSAKLIDKQCLLPALTDRSVSIPPPPPSARRPKHTAPPPLKFVNLKEASRPRCPVLMTHGPK